MPPAKNKEKLTRQALWFEEHGMTSVGLHGKTYRQLDKLRRAKSKEIGVKLLSWNDFILIVIDKGLRGERR